MAIPDNYIDKITKGNDSRMISPAADMVRVNNDNFDGETLDEVLDDVAQAIGEAGEAKSVTINGTNHTPDSSGVIDLGTVITAHQDISGKANTADLATVATSGSYNDLSNKPTIPDVSTLATKTELNGKQDAINDLASIRSGAAAGATALQSYTETDPTVPSWAKNSTKPSYTASEVGAVPTTRTINGKALSNNITLSQSDIPGLVAALAAKVGYSDDEWMQVKAGAIQATTAVQDTTTVNGKRLNNNITIQMADIPGLLQAIGEAGSGAVSVTTNQDGTFTIHVGETDYSINLNHTHEGMAKLVVCEESDLPSTLEASTIYAVKNGDETGIETVYFGGLPFTASAPQQLPYDAEVEYLQSTGTQYIGTGVQMQSTFKCEIKAQFDQNNDGFDTLVGALDGSNKYGVVLGLKNSNGGGSIYSQIGGNESIADCAATPLALHVFTTQLMNGTISIDADGVSGTHAFSGSLPTNSLFLFARNKATVGNFCNAKIYYCKIWNVGALVRNFIPVRVGQVGYMYDKVSKQLFGNSGTGSFTLGNDK